MRAWPVIALAILAGCSTPPAKPPPPVTWHCTRVIDGDTIVAERSDRPGEPEHIRLYGIDAPEHNLPGGPEATAEMRILADGKQINLISHGKDKYGRLLDEVSVDGQDLSQTMLKKGLAVPYYGGKRDSKQVSETVEAGLTHG